MKAKNNLTSIDDLMNSKYGEIGSPEREQFRREAQACYFGQIIHDVRKEEGMTQAELAQKSGLDKSYISRIEKGLIEPGIGTFNRIVEALGLRLDVSKPLT